MALTRDLVVDGALRLVDEGGLEGLTLRRLAGRLGVQAPTLYWHVANKAELLDALADAILDDALAAVPDAAGYADWREWLLAALTELRRAMLAHTDGARIVTGARTSLRRADFSELALSTLVTRGVALQRARLTVLAGERFTTGHVLEEQEAVGNGRTPTPDPEELARRLPTATRAIREYFGAGRTADDSYEDVLRLILGLPPGVDD